MSKPGFVQRKPKTKAQLAQKKRRAAFVRREREIGIKLARELR